MTYKPRNLFFETMVRGIFFKTLKKRMHKIVFKEIPIFLKKKLPKIIKYILYTPDRILTIISRSIISKNRKVCKNKVLFMTFQNTYTCNPKYVANELIKRKKNYDLVWVVDKNTDLSVIPSEIRTVKRNSYQFFEEIATSKFWIDNAMNCIWQRIPIKKNQYYIQLWHGSLGFKKFGAEFDKNKIRVKKSSYGDTDTTYCITNSIFEENVFKNTYWPNVENLRYGHARNDILFYKDSQTITELKNKICNKYGININKKFVLYAPTFRDNKKTNCFNINYDRLIETLSEKFGGEWVVLSKLHFHNLKAKVKYSSRNVINVTNYPDIQELMAISEIAITDYSSWICDFVLTRRPGFIYAPDYFKYLDERGFYYPLNTTPFPISINNDELIENILNFDIHNYENEVEEFLDDKGCMEDGHASERIVDKIIEIIEN